MKPAPSPASPRRKSAAPTGRFAILRSANVAANGFFAIAGFSLKRRRDSPFQPRRRCPTLHLGGCTKNTSLLSALSQR
jgi:hypothetical protein